MKHAKTKSPSASPKKGSPKPHSTKTPSASPKGAGKGPKFAMRKGGEEAGKGGEGKGGEGKAGGPKRSPKGKGKGSDSHFPDALCAVFCDPAPGATSTFVEFAFDKAYVSYYP